MNTHIITVATHKEGKLNDLLDNSFNTNIKVLGMGEKWTGFKMKNELIYKFIKHIPDNELIIYLDGFDSEIKMNPQQAIERFKKNNYKLLFSKELGSNFFHIDTIVWPSCKGNTKGNSGLFMGYAKYMKLFMRETLKSKCKDDQVVMNSLCSKFDFIEIDMDENIFQNLKISNGFKYNNKAVFVSYPGGLSFKRLYRSLFEYGQFVFLPLFFIYLSIIYFISTKKKLKHKYIYIIFISLLFSIYLFKADKSCMDYSMGIKHFI
jgi:hypothetical protein